MKRIIQINYVFCLGLILFIAAPLYASVSLKISASNPSNFADRIVPLKTFLPKGILPDNVIDSDGLDVDYDEEREQTYVYKDLDLKVREAASFDIVIDDIWLIEEGELGSLRQRARTIAGELENTEYINKALKLKIDIENYLTEISNLQENSLVIKTGPIEHISAYEINKETLGLVKEMVTELEQLLQAVKDSKVSGKEANSEGKAQAERIYTKEVKEKVLNIDQAGKSGCLVEIALEEEKEAVDFNTPKTSSFRIVIENPSKIDTKTVPVRYFLTKEIKGRDVIDTSGLKIGFDFERELFYVYSKGVELHPAETKTFDIILENRWTIDKKGLYKSKVYIESMIRAGTNAQEEAEAIKKLGEKSIELNNQLLKRKEMKELSGKQLESYRDDKEKSLELERSIEEMEDLLLVAGISPADSLIGQEEHCLEARAEGLSKKEMEAGLRDATIMETQRIKAMVGTVFKGKAASGASTWKIIYYIIIFLGIISSVFYFVNIREQKSVMFDPLTGAFTRAYILERLREELKIAKGANTKCSLLVMDIDKFKGINDTHGHAVGDTILKEFVIAMRKGVRATDLIGRFGGDEFVIVLPTSEKKTAHKIAEGVARIIEGTVITVSPKLSVNITTSIGIATFPDDSGTADDVFNKADQALYVVKKRGGNGAESYGEQA